MNGKATHSPSTWFQARRRFFSHSNPNQPPSTFSSPAYAAPSSDSHHPKIAFFSKCQTWSQISQMQAHLITCGLFPHSPLAVRLLEQSARVAELGRTLSIFRSLDTASTFCVNTVIKAFEVSSLPDGAVGFYFQMVRNGFVPNSYSFVPLFGVCSKVGSDELVRKCHGVAIRNGVDMELPVQNCLIHTYSCCGLLEFASKVFGEMSQRDITSWNSILNGLVKAGNLSSAWKLFDVMRERNVVSWNTMIVANLQAGFPGCALKLFREMTNTGIKGTERTVSAVLSACGRSNRLNEGRSVHGFVAKNLSNMSVHLTTALVDMYCKCRRVALARHIFNKFPRKNLACWNAMILGHSIHGNPEDGLHLFTEMTRRNELKREKIRPDEITFIGVLCGCARARFLAEGINYYNQMVDEYRIKPNFAHLWCMANLYVSSGLLQQAEEMLMSLPADEGSSSEPLFWADLLGSCRFAGDVTLGEKVATSLIQKEPMNHSYYQLLLNVYAVAGQWDNVGSVREMMKKRKLERTPGCNLVDLKEIVHDLKARN